MVTKPVVSETSANLMERQILGPLNQILGLGALDLWLNILHDSGYTEIWEALVLKQKRAGGFLESRLTYREFYLWQHTFPEVGVSWSI